jgi:3-keto-5-aminohexanoate cleavage enzyme
MAWICTDILAHYLTSTSCGGVVDETYAQSKRRTLTMSSEHPAVICCSISGSLATRDQCPAIPYTPEDYAAEARRIVDEGGVHIHIHARTRLGAPSYEPEDFGAIAKAIRDEVGDGAIINFSTGAVGVSVEKRLAYLRAHPPEVAAVNMGSMNYAKYSKSRNAFVFDMVFQNPFSEIIEFLEAMSDLRIKPELECFDLGHVGSIAPLLDLGALHAPVHADFVMGVLGGVPATPLNLEAMARNLPDGDHHWGVIGIGRVQWKMLATALALGGSIRVGVEDNFYLPDGAMARSNGELVAAARHLTELSGRRVATVAEARALLGIPSPVAA